MKNIVNRLFPKRLVMLIAFSALICLIASGQPGRTTRSSRGASTRQTQGRPLDIDTTKTIKKDTLIIGLPPRPDIDPLKFDSVPSSNGLDDAIESILKKDRSPLEYEHIREDDALYRERVWRIIDINEKMNLAFRYKGQDDNGSQDFFSILLNGIRKGLITPYDPTGNNDRFTSPLPMEALVSKLYGGDYLELVDKLDTSRKDASGKIIKAYKQVWDRKVIDLDSIVSKYQVKEEWIFDKESSRMFTRILGIAPMRTTRDQNGKLIETPLFWVHYPSIRPVLAMYDVYNGKNFSGRISWEELFELRYFSSIIVKSTIDNPGNLSIKDYIKDSRLRLLESENIKNKIFNYELGLWHY